MTITHAKVSAVADGADTSLVRPSDWNADHIGHGFGPEVVTVGPVGSGAQFTGSTGAPIQAAVESITDSSITKPYTILLYPGTYTLGSSASDEIRLDGLSNTKDYISLLGMDTRATILSRPSSPGVSNAVLVAADHCTIGHLTLDSSASRLIHWDRSAGSQLTVFDVWLKAGGGGNGISAGVTGNGSRMVVQDCVFGTAAISCHNGTIGATTDFGEILVNGCTATSNASSWIGIDMTIGSNQSIRLFLSGNTGKFFNVDPTHNIDVKLSDSNACRFLAYTDFQAGIVWRNSNSVTKFWNRILWPQMQAVIALTTYAEGEVLAATLGQNSIRPATASRTTSADAQWPVVVCFQEDDSGTSTWYPRIATGPYAEVICDTAAVSVNDTLVTTTTNGQAKANNAQTDLTRVIGWALTAKAGGSSGRVTVRMNPVTNRW